MTFAEHFLTYKLTKQKQINGKYIIKIDCHQLVNTEMNVDSTVICPRAVQNIKDFDDWNAWVILYEIFKE